MAKAKFDFKDFLLKKGEYVALGAAGFGFLVLLLLGMSSWSGAANPAEISKDLNTKAESIDRAIRDQNDATTPPPLPKWAEAGKKFEYNPVALAEFPQSGLLFDPTGRPDHKRKNPSVLGIEEYQVDLVHGAMRGYDIIYPPDGAKIAVQVTRKIESQDTEKLRKDFNKIKKNGGRGFRKPKQHQDSNPGMPGSAGGSTTTGGPPPGPGPAAMGPYGGGRGMRGGMGSGSMSGGYDAGAQRTETSILYIPLDDLDKETDKQPAQTVIPLRMAVINCTIPLKAQLEEVKKAMRLESLDQARQFTNFDGFEVQRQVSWITPDGNLKIITPWQKYNYEDRYVELIAARKLSDYFDNADPKLGKYLPYFYRYEDRLVMPLPDLVPELSSYPPVKIKTITNAIAKLAAAETPKAELSDLAKRLNKKGSRDDLWTPQSGADTGAANIYGKNGFSSPAFSGSGPGKGPMTNPNGGGDNPPVVDIDQLLLRFVDCDVQPGLFYEYAVRLRMINPNRGFPQYLSNPADAKEEILFSPWVRLGKDEQGLHSMPEEDFLFADDFTSYHAKIAENFKKQAFAQRMLQVKDNQAVVQQVRWLQTIRMEGNQEPIGGWVAGSTPVGRGEYIGKKTYLKLPLWSSVQNEYVFREHTGAAGKGKDLPKQCWPVNFTTQNVLVDFEGGKVTARTESGRTLLSEEVPTEMLILTEEGKLMVRRSSDDAADPERRRRTGVWDNWVKKVEARPTAAPTTGSGNQFERPTSKP